MILQILKHFGMNNENANRAWIDFKSIDISILKLHMDTIEKTSHGEDEEEPLEHLDCSNEAQNFTIHLCNILEKFVEYSNISHEYSKMHAYLERAYFVQNVFPVVTNFTHRSVTNYLALRFIISHLDDLSHFFRVLKLSHPDMVPVNADHTIGLNKWEHCTEWISHYMSYPLGQEYVRKMLPEKHMEDIRNIVRTFIQDAGYYVLKQRWMKKSTRKKFITSIENLKNTIEHYVNFLKNGTRFSSYMTDFHPQNESFLKNALDYRKLTFRFYLLNFRALEDEEFPSDPFIVNAYHSPGVLDLRFGIFLPPVYQYGRPRLLNIATMGTTIGHELGHEIVAFLEDPENFDNDTLQIYGEKKKCLEEQYSNFEVKKIGQKVNGKQTIHENLADLIGIEITQQIITRFLKRGNENQFLLPALDYSTEQILYIALAQMWCSVSSKEKEQLHHDRDVHAPSDVRIAGILRNLREFSEAFGCIQGNFMSPVDRCAFRLRS
ncbi:endothelin-converting enzyme 2 [Nephila pilipes]|uniref:Endothelin-converting enzyme 2 n=1 Tax=Nephila pilipes TaxID=299642 RepID=A0A8X6TL67_NEPPI|nr:endothelin-converting enzyme 2 [Nephila pilipes]